MTVVDAVVMAQMIEGVLDSEMIHFLGQPAKVGSSMRMTHHEDAETFFC